MHCCLARGAVWFETAPLTRHGQNWHQHAIMRYTCMHVYVYWYVHICIYLSVTALFSLKLSSMDYVTLCTCF